VDGAAHALNHLQSMNASAMATHVCMTV
jgi:hypothetical protein